MDTPSHRIKMQEPVEAITTYTEIPVVIQQENKKTPDPKKEDNAL